jgi:cytochrome c biogenesis protein
LREKASSRYAEKVPLDAKSNANLREQLKASSARSLNVFIGDRESSGYVAIARFIGKLPEDQQEKAADLFMKILNGSLWELWQLAREKDGLPVMTADEKMRWRMHFFMRHPSCCNCRDLNRLRHPYFK